MPDGSRSFAPASDDLERVATLYRAHVGFVARVLRRCGVAEPDLDDAVQETFLVAYRRMHEFEGRASETTWLYAIAVRVASTLRRARRREVARRERAGAGMHGRLEVDPESELSRAQAAEILDTLLDTLDDKKRTVFVLAELEGLEASEISRIVGVKVPTVYSRLRLARQDVEAAARRFTARQDGRRRRAQLRTQTLAARGEPAHTPRRAALAALCVRIGEGATPMLPGWEQVSLAALPSASFFVPLAATLGVGGLGLAAVAVAVGPADAAPENTTTVRAHDRTDASTPASVRPPPRPHRAAASVTEAADTPVVASSSTAALASPRRVTPARDASRRQAQAPDPVDAAPPQSAPSVTPAEPIRGDDFDAELKLLERARVALAGGDPSSALTALDAHALQFSEGQLAAERELTRVEALCRVGRTSDANAAAGRARPDREAAMAVYRRACGSD